MGVLSNPEMAVSPEREPDRSAWRTGIGAAIFIIGISAGIAFKQPCMYPATGLLETIYWAAVLGEKQKERNLQNSPPGED